MREETLIDLDVAGKTALVIGGNPEAESKARKLVDSGAKVTVVAASFTPGLRRMGRSGRIRAIQSDPGVPAVWKAVEELRPRAVFVSTGDGRLDEQAAEVARGAGALVCVTDTPRLNDFNMPAIAKVGDIRVGISTGGRSPAMAGILRRRVEELIDREDVLQVKLQGELRQASKAHLRTPESRKKFVYEVINDKQVGLLLRRGEYERAKRLAEKLLIRAGKRDGKGKG